MHPKTRFTLLAMRACYWLMLSLLLTSTPKSLSTGLFASHLSPRLYLCPTLLHPKCRIWHLALLNFMPSPTVQCSNLPQSLCNLPQPFREMTAPSSSVLPAKLLRMHSTPPSRSFTFKRTDYTMEPWGTSLVTCHRLDVEPLTTTL